MRLARDTYPSDFEIQLIAETLQLSQDALSYDAAQFPAQLLGRIPYNINYFLDQNPVQSKSKKKPPKKEDRYKVTCTFVNKYYIAIYCKNMINNQCAATKPFINLHSLALSLLTIWKKL